MTPAIFRAVVFLFDVSSIAVPSQRSPAKGLKGPVEQCDDLPRAEEELVVEIDEGQQKKERQGENPEENGRPDEHLLQADTLSSPVRRFASVISSADGNVSRWR